MHERHAKSQFTSKTFPLAVAHGVVGGARTEPQGGTFGQGFAGSVSEEDFDIVVALFSDGLLGDTKNKIDTRNKF